MSFDISTKVGREALHKRFLVHSPGGHPFVLVITPYSLHYMRRQISVTHPLLCVPPLHSHLLQPQCERLQVCLINPQSQLSTHIAGWPSPLFILLKIWAKRRWDFENRPACYLSRKQTRASRWWWSLWWRWFPRQKCSLPKFALRNYKTKKNRELRLSEKYFLLSVNALKNWLLCRELKGESRRNKTVPQREQANPQGVEVSLRERHRVTSDLCGNCILINPIVEGSTVCNRVAVVGQIRSPGKIDGTIDVTSTIKHAFPTVNPISNFAHFSPARILPLHRKQVPNSAQHLHRPQIRTI